MATHLNINIGTEQDIDAWESCFGVGENYRLRPNLHAQTA